MTDHEVQTAACVMHERGEKCGTTWYSFTAHAHTVGVCDAKGRKYSGRIATDKKDGQVTVSIVNNDGEAVRAVAVDLG